MLPLGNSGETARQLFEAIREVIHVDFPAGDRLVFLECCRMPVRQVCLALEKHYLDKPVPLPDRTRKIADLAIEFHHGLAIGYIQVLSETLGHNPVPTLLNRKSVLRDLIRAVCHLNQAIIKSYQTYVPVPENAWWELHHLYLYAVRQNLHDRAMEEGLFYSEPVTVENLYKQILSVAVADPASLTGRQIAETFDFLKTTASHARLQTHIHTSLKGEMVLGINLESDAPPFQVNRRDKDTLATVSYFFNPVPLVELLQKDKNSEEPRPGLKTDLRNRLIRAWEGVQQRRHERRPGRGRAEVVVGLSRLHRTLTAEIEAPSMDLSLRRRGPEMHSKRTTESEKKVTCPIIDESQKGYRLLWFDDEDIQASVGMLVGVAQKLSGQSAKNWNVGVIRWVRTDRSGTAEMGVETLLTGAVPAEIAVLDAYGEMNSHMLQCLKVPSLPEIDQMASLVAPSLMAQTHQKLKLQYKEHGETVDEVVRMVRVTQKTRYFCCFEYQDDNLSLILDEEAGEGSSDADNFSLQDDEIWRLI